jgi:L-alanine-DL-glutamate epimerase-like enolase superfamily enzyme
MAYCTTGTDLKEEVTASINRANESIEEKGYRAFKVHKWPGKTWVEWNKFKPIDNGSPEDIISILREFRGGIDPSVSLAADIHYHYALGWTLDEVVEVAKYLEKAGWAWLEGTIDLDPSKKESLAFWKTLRKVAPTLNLENEASYANVYNVIGVDKKYYHLFDKVTVDEGAQGMTGSILLARWCLEHNKLFDVHRPGCYSLQVAAMLDESVYTCFEHGLWVCYHEPQVKDGYIDIPQGVGIGLGCDWDRIEKNITEEIGGQVEDEK